MRFGLTAIAVFVMLTIESAGFGDRDDFYMLLAGYAALIFVAIIEVVSLRVAMRKGRSNES